MSLEEDDRLRADFMNGLYEETEDSALTWIDPEEIGYRIGIKFGPDLYLLIEQLRRAGSVEKAFDNSVRLTETGVRDVLRARASTPPSGRADLPGVAPDESTDKPVRQARARQDSPAATASPIEDQPGTTAGAANSSSHEPAKTPRWRGWNGRHPTAIALWVAVASALIVAGVFGLIHLVIRPVVPAETVADQIANCVRTHHMDGSSEGPVTPPAEIIDQFSDANNGRYSSTDPVYGEGPIPVTLFESCSWPPKSGEDATGYSQILVSTVPGDVVWPGLISPFTYADVFDSACDSLTVYYEARHTLSSALVPVRVAAGKIIVVDPQMNVGTPPGPGGKLPKTVSSWAQTVGYYVDSGESVILHEGDFHILRIECRP
jgi:hypothetical protein